MAARPNVACRNCGLVGHVYRTCNHPTISFGIIAARPPDADCGEARYLLIQRRDSLNFIDFVRGKYHPQDVEYLRSMFAHMTDDERARLAAPDADFAALWAAVWHRPPGAHHGSEFAEARSCFEALREGYPLRTGDGAVVQVSLRELVRTTTSAYPTEREWGFPKGRRKTKESDRDAAVREFAEETLYSASDLELEGQKPIEETFVGTNGVRYRHVYFLAHMRRHPVAAPRAVDPANVQQAREVSEVRWFTRAQVLERIRPHNVERRHLFARVADLVERRMAAQVAQVAAGCPT